MAKRKRPRAKPISLHPLEPGQALAGLFRVKPEKPSWACAWCTKEFDQTPIPEHNDRHRLVCNGSGEDGVDLSAPLK